MQGKPTSNRSVAGEVVAVYDKSSGVVHLDLNIGRDRPIKQIPLALTLSLDGHTYSIIVKTSKSTANET